MGDKHTPLLPLHIVDISQHGGDEAAISDANGRWLTVTNKQTANLITKAVNHHQELVGALKKAHEDIHNFHRDYVHYEGGKVDKELNRIWSEINQALTKLEGK